MWTRQWSSSEISDSFGHCANLKDLISAVEKVMWGEGQVVCEIHVNGERLAEQDEQNSAHRQVGDIRTMMVRTEAPETLLLKTIDDLVQMLPGFRDKCCTTADRFRFHDLHSAHEAFSEVIEICRYVTDVLFVVRNRLPQGSLSSIEITYQKAVSDILSAFEKSDFAVMADILEYDLTNVLVEFQDQLTNLSGRASIGEW